MNFFEIPLTPAAQRFRISLGSSVYLLTWAWNSVSGSWVLDIATDEGVPIVSGLPIITGADILGQHKHLGIKEALIAQTDNDSDRVPTLQSLGITSHCYVVEVEE